jgi:hypothetical protein
MSIPASIFEVGDTIAALADSYESAAKERKDKQLLMVAAALQTIPTAIETHNLGTLHKVLLEWAIKVALDGRMTPTEIMDQFAKGREDSKQYEQP